MVWFLVQDTGYVLIVYDNVSVETSLWVALVLVVLGTFTAYVLLHMLLKAIRGLNQMKKWRQAKHETALLKESNVALLEGPATHPVASDEVVNKVVKSKQPSLLSLLQEAEVLHQRGDIASRDKIFQQATHTFPRVKDDLELRQLSLDLSLGYNEERFARIEELFTTRPKHQGIQLLYLQACVQGGYFERVRDLVPKLRKQSAINNEELDELEVEIWQNAVKEARLSNQSDLRKLLPKHLRKNLALQVQFLQSLRDRGDQRQALEVIETELRGGWNSTLVELYGLIQLDAPRQLKVAQGWLNQHSNDLALTLTLARLSSHCEENERAREYYEQVIRRNPSRDVHLELAEVCRRLGSNDLFLSHLKRAEQLLLTETLNRSLVKANA